MKKTSREREARRRLLKLMGQTAIVLPLASLGACGGEDAPPPAPADSTDTSGSTAEDTMKDMADSADEIVEEAKDMADDAAGDVVESVSAE